MTPPPPRRFPGIPLDAVRGWELRERCALRYHRVAGDAYGVVLEGEEEEGTWCYAPVFPRDAREPEGRKVEVVTAGEGFKSVVVRWRTPEKPTAPPSPGALR